MKHIDKTQTIVIIIIMIVIMITVVALIIIRIINKNTKRKLTNMQQTYYVFKTNCVGNHHRARNSQEK